MLELLHYIDVHRSPIFVEVGLREASHRQNEWFMGERENRQINPTRASVDWTVHYAKAFSERFKENMHSIMAYVANHRTEVLISDKGTLYFTDKQFNDLMTKGFRYESNVQARQLLAA